MTNQLDGWLSRPLVIIESPYAGDIRRNEEYLSWCLLDSIQRGEAPFASHRMYTSCLDETNPQQRILGIECGFAWLAKAAQRHVFYTDNGWSLGMIKAYKLGHRLGVEPVIRALENEPLPYPGDQINGTLA